MELVGHSEASAHACVYVYESGRVCRWVSLKIHEDCGRSEVEVGAAAWESEGEENGYRHPVY